MASLSHPLYLELFADNEASRLMVALLHEDGYDELRPPRTRPVNELEAQFSAFERDALAIGQLHWAIRRRSTDLCFGSLQATRNGAEAISVGYRVHPAYQGVGIATAALRILVVELTARYPRVALTASVRQDNEASLRVLQKAGFRPGSSPAGSSELKYVFAGGSAA